MLPGERFKNYVGETANSFKDTAGSWWHNIWLTILSKFLVGINPAANLIVKGYFTKIKDDPNSTNDQKAFAVQVLEGPEAAQNMTAWMLAILGALPGLLALGRPQANVIGYEQDRKVRSFRLDPISVITAWRRDSPKYEKLFDDLRDQGFSDDRIEALKFATLFYPGPADLVNWQAKEVFEPAMVAKYGLDDEFGEIDLVPFRKAGMTDEQSLNYWRAHWEHASFSQMVEMLHRKLITEQDLYDWYRLVEIVPYWRNKLTEIAYTWPTRVDVRRWWDMRTIDEPRLRELYEGMGYRGKNLDDYVLWTKVYVAFPDLMSRWTNGWITEEDVRSELVGIGMPGARVDEMIKQKKKNVESAQVESEKNLTKAEIYKGVKQGTITRDEAIDLLIDLNYTETQATYLLDINIPVDEEVSTVTTRELTKTDIINGLKAEIITEGEAKTKLVELRYSPTDADFLLKIFKATISPPTETKDREASKADIIKAVKTGLIIPEDGYLMLQDIGFTPEASQFILAVQAETSPFSPINYAEFKKLTTEYKKAIGKGEEAMPEEIVTAGQELVHLTKDVDDLTLAVKEEEKGLIDVEVRPPEAEAKLKSLQTKLHRAQAKLAKAQTDYNIKVAEWKYGTKT